MRTYTMYVMSLMPFKQWRVVFAEVDCACTDREVKDELKTARGAIETHQKHVSELTEEVQPPIPRHSLDARTLSLHGCPDHSRRPCHAKRVRAGTDME